MIVLSIIIPIYNVKIEYFCKCITSICSQKQEEIEIIIIDDGSTMGCATFCDECAKLDTRIRVIHQKNCGVSVTRNKGIDYAKGKYIMFVDADDMISSVICKYIIDQMDMFSDDILIFQYTKDENEIEKSQDSILIHEKLKKSELDQCKFDLILEKESFSNYCIGAPWGKAFKVDFLKENNLFFIESLYLMEDRFFMLYCLEKNPNVSLLNHIGYYYNINDESVSVKLDPDIEDIADRIILELNIFNSKYNTISKMLVNQFYTMLFFKCLYKNCFHLNNKKNFWNRIKQLRDISVREPFKDSIKNVKCYTQTKKKRFIMLLLRLHLYSLIMLYISIRNMLQKNGVR